jgi:hypothetical protein
VLLGLRHLPPAAGKFLAAEIEEAALFNQALSSNQIAAVFAAGPTPASTPVPLAKWTFATDARDVIGSMNGTLHGGATISNGRLMLNGTDAYMATAPLPKNVTEKTLTVLLSLSTLNQGGGGAMTLETQDGVTFDSIVYAERQPMKWMAGSDNWSRTSDVAGSQETSPSNLVHVAIVYRADNSITLYHNGQPYGDPYTPANHPLITYQAGSANVLLGLRHLPPAAGKFLAAEIEEAALYDQALSATQIAALVPSNITVQPELSVAYSSAQGTVTISWPVGITGFILQSSDSLPATKWLPVPGVTNNNSVTIVANSKMQFYRLSNP